MYAFAGDYDDARAGDVEGRGNGTGHGSSAVPPGRTLRGFSPLHLAGVPPALAT